MGRLVRSVVHRVCYWVGRPRPIVVSLEELAPWWLRFNTGFSPIEVEKSDLHPVSNLNEPHETSAPKAKPVSTLSQLVAKYREVLEAQKVWPGIQKVVGVLEREGGCPSIVLNNVNVDQEGRDLGTFRDILKSVTLRDHTERMTRLVLEEVGNVYRDGGPLIPKALVVGLSHDLGKIPVFRESGMYSKQDHPEISAMKLQELFEGERPFWFEDALTAIRDHHRFSTDPFCSLVKRADARAREQEIVAVAGEYQVKAVEEWIDLEELVKALFPEVNVLNRKNQCVAFSFQDVVYCDPEGMFQRIQKLAKEGKVLDLRLYRDSERETILCQLVNRFRNVEYLARAIGEGFYGQNFRISVLQGKNTKVVRKYLIPLKLSVFGVLASSLESRKSGWLEVIQQVESV